MDLKEKLLKHSYVFDKNFYFMYIYLNIKLASFWKDIKKLEGSRVLKNILFFT
jgi:hypothetical protein